MRIFTRKVNSNFIIFLIFLISILFVYLTVRYDLFFSFSSKEREEINFYVFLATAVIACIACYEFKRSHELTANEFLLFISNRWGTKEIIKARQILHGLFISSYRDKKGNTKCV